MSHATPLPRSSPFTPVRPWAPLSGGEWAALWPYLCRDVPQGRQVGDLRARMDAIFHVACRGHGVPWREVPEVYGKPDTVSRFFRRLTHAGLWHRLLKSLAHPDLPPEHPVRQIAHYVVRAARRAARLGGLRLLFLIKRLNMQSALPGPPWLLPDQFCHDLVTHRLAPMLADEMRPRTGERWRNTRARIKRFTRTLKHFHKHAAGWRRIHPSLKRDWP